MVNQFNTIALDKEMSKSVVRHLSDNVFEVEKDGNVEVFEVLNVDLATKELTVRHRHRVYDIAFKNELDLVLDKMGIKRSVDNLNTDIKAPMPGKVLDVAVKAGDKVAKGDTILILEAMKMENVLKAENDCSIKKVNVVSSDNVEKNQVLVELDVV
ncbi:acetyl-CoA carboxylase biotin carboxyl carrier protein subunit [Paracrocinitomix mangrovi]|uniref:acetyl-CoA carboxylase biotin carboxyl carrier protein subunit n=1 Tax=Paracrocinitomix mangrovi TaxID=2862509 RepID=UPI001C8D046F|nr:biotin/lipoyl-containing protein [Paracrocinitomix mangrovi]